MRSSAFVLWLSALLMLAIPTSWSPTFADELSKAIVIDVRVPTVDDPSMKDIGAPFTKATIGRWLRKTGETVATLEPLVELETDMVTILVSAPSAGVLGEIAAKDGDTVVVGDLLVRIYQR